MKLADLDESDFSDLSEPDRFPAARPPAPPPPVRERQQTVIAEGPLPEAQCQHAWRGDAYRTCLRCGAHVAPAIDRQVTVAIPRLPPPLPPEVLRDRQQTTIAPVSYEPRVSLSERMAAAEVRAESEVGVLRERLRRLESAASTARANLVALDTEPLARLPHDSLLPWQRARIRQALTILGLALGDG